MIRYLKASLFHLCLLAFSVTFAVGGALAAAPAYRSACTTCPKCNTCCELKVEKGEDDRYCWEIETKEICIPRVVFPWQKDCRRPGINNGAKVKTVRVLKKRDYTCPTCTYTWTPVERATRSCQCEQCQDAAIKIDAAPAAATIEQGRSATAHTAPVIAWPGSISTAR